MASRFTLLLALCVLGLVSRAAAAASPELLQEAVENWLGERDYWAFTQRAIEHERDRPYERLERYDPSKPHNQRWQLLAINGRPPTEEQRQKWADKKFKRRPKKFETPIGDFFDFRSAKVLGESAKLVEFEVPLRRDKNWLFPTDKVAVRVTVSKETGALEHLTAHVREPFKVLLGLARVLGGKVELDFYNLDNTEPSPDAAQPAGSARVSVTRFGERVDFTWSDFKRVTPYRAPAAAMNTTRLPADG